MIKIKKIEFFLSPGAPWAPWAQGWGSLLLLLLPVQTPTLREYTIVSTAKTPPENGLGPRYFYSFPRRPGHIWPRTIPDQTRPGQARPDQTRPKKILR